MDSFRLSALALALGSLASLPAVADTVIGTDVNHVIVQPNNDGGSTGAFIVEKCITAACATFNTIFTADDNANGGSVFSSNLSVNGTTTTAGITNTGNVGTDTLSTTGAATLNSASITNNATVGGTLGVTGATTTAGITNTGNVGTDTLSTTGAATLNSASITNNATVGGTLGVTGQTTTAGIGNTGLLANTGNMTNSGTFVNTGAATLNGATQVNNTLDVTGTTNVNTSGTAATAIGNTTGTVAITGSTNTVLGTTSINTTGALATTLGANGNVTSINSSSVNVGAGAYTTGVAIGSTQAGTTVIGRGGNSTLSVANGSASLTSGSSGLTTTSAAQTLSSDSSTLATQLNNVGDAASRANIGGATYVNRLEGNTLINGNTYINGTLVYSSNSAATTTVTSGVSVLAGATQATSGQSAIVNSGGSGAQVDGNGKITTGIVSQTTASMTITNGVGNTHGFVVTETQATISGGTRSSSLTLDDNGATFSNSATGQPVQVHGVADGSEDHDAVNYRQLKRVAAGVAGVSAMANIPQVDENKTFSVGVGLGNFQSKNSMALGASYRFAPSAVVKASIAGTDHGGKTTVFGLGAGFSW